MEALNTVKDELSNVESHLEDATRDLSDLRDALEELAGIQTIEPMIEIDGRWAANVYYSEDKDKTQILLVRKG